MAEVWRAHDEVLERDVAVKLLSARFRDDEDFTARFRREAQQAASLNHPNVVGVYDTGTHGDLPYIVMELISGRSLQEVLADGGVTEERAVEICSETCAALEYAHGRGLVHRDVKPGNILLADDGAVKVTDFGIARAINTDTVTQTAAVLGTAAYLSPEQAQGFPVDNRSDIYSLGIVLYEMLTGEQPFRGDTAVGVAYQHVQENPPPPREWDPGISQALEAIVMKALAKNPANRYPSAQEMREDLLRAQAGRPVTAPAVLHTDDTAYLEGDAVPVGRPPLTETQEKRRRTVGYALLALLVLAAFGLAIWLLAGLFGGDDPVLRTVPSVIGETPTQAQASLEARGLEARFVGQEYDPEIPEGRVMRQDPDAGSEVEDGSFVELVLSRGPEPVQIPDVEGMPEEAAVAELRDAGLSIGERSTEFSDEVPRGHVISTDPPVGRTVDRGTSVRLLISAGEETEIVPRVVGLLEAEARFQLEDRGFNVLVVREFSDSVDRGRVIRQEPEGNTEVRVGADVTIVVSEGPAEPTPEPEPEPPPEEEEEEEEEPPPEEEEEEEEEEDGD
jgi:eukaryotic-like serine/threonine-protein kinase